MSTGLIALLDDVVSIAKVAAASIDDVAGQAAKAGAKSAGVVIDDTAVTPRYVVGFSADREIPIVLRIAAGSLRNKLLILLPLALLLSFFAPWVIVPMLMLGGLFLCYEGAEKVLEAFLPHEAHAHEAKVGLAPGNAKALEDRKVAGAIRTDFILSAEIMAIALSSVPDAGLTTQAIVLAVVGVGITVGVYGVVGLIVKADDFGVALARSRWRGPLGGPVRGFGRWLVGIMPAFLKTLAGVGTAAMVWVGGGILVHGLAHFGIDAVEHGMHQLAVAAAHSVPAAQGVVEWVVGASCAGLFGLVAGAVTIPVVGRVVAPVWRRVRTTSA
jgi:predicted DNA repair protein MutK